MDGRQTKIKKILWPLLELEHSSDSLFSVSARGFERVRKKNYEIPPVMASERPIPLRCTKPPHTRPRADGHVWTCLGATVQERAPPLAGRGR